MMRQAVTHQAWKQLVGCRLRSCVSIARGQYHPFASTSTTATKLPRSPLKNPHADLPWIVAAAVALCATESTFHCSQTEEATESRWVGVSEGDIDDFVNLMLADETINMTAIPDALERVIYKSAVSITLEAVCDTLGTLDGLELFGHEVQLMQRARDANSVDRSWIVSKHLGVDDEILERVADRLLANQSINQTLVPDVVERQLYVNVLRLVFRLLDTIAASFVITICGHDLRLQFEPSAEAASRVSVTHLTQVSVDDLRRYARSGLGGVEPGSFGLYGEFMTQLNTSLYGLILGIIDDVLANTEIEILSDRIGVDIVPIRQQPLWKNAVLRGPKPNAASGKSHGTVGLSTMVSFGVGVGVGALVMAFASKGN